MTKPKKKRKAKRLKLTAKTADKHVLYQKSVQDPTDEIRHIEKAYKRKNGRWPRSVREDFCGSALFCAAWVQSRSGRTAVGVDLDPKVLEWGREHNLARIGEPGNRIALWQQDVRTACNDRFDVVMAYNFSYWVFQTRDDLREYFQRARESLQPDGVFCLDSYGGTEAGEVMKEERWVEGGEYEDFVYVWDQAEYDPISHHVLNHIHFRFKDKTRMDKAFTYDWRFWTLPELQELLKEAGFEKIDVYWDVSPDDDESVYKAVKSAQNQPGWLAYIVAS